MANGSLHGYIHGCDGKGKAPMPPVERLRIAPESAHTRWRTCTHPPHRRSCKATSSRQTSCLTYGELTAKVSGFGAPRLAPVEEAQVTR
jgi:hypothetical protein